MNIGSNKNKQKEQKGGQATFFKQEGLPHYDRHGTNSW